MGYNLTKRISDLQQQADDSNIGKLSFGRGVVLFMLFLGVFSSLVLPQNPSPYKPVEEGEEEPDLWHEEIQSQFKERAEYLATSPLVLWPGAVGMYEGLGASLERTFKTNYGTGADEEAVVSFESILVFLGRSAVSISLRAGFIIIAFWPLWIASFLIGFFALRRQFVQKKSETLLGACDRPNGGPFYSGVYGPLLPNNSFSGTDYSCPSLACPKMEKKSIAIKHKLVQTLRKHKALNETTLGLVQIILAHSNFPCTVGEENFSEEEPTDSEERTSRTGYLTNEGGTLERSAIEGLAGILEAHRKLSFYVDSLQKKNIRSAALNKNYPGHLANLKKLTEAMSPLGKLLLVTLTPNRQWALGQVDATMVATAYLATEAGKALVFKRHDQGFVRTSNYPHLQARAVVQSLPAFHREYDGDKRLIIRQAIICSRRHGDFGRAFLPIRMPLESRALRDWLEILYAEPEKRSEAAQLVELDGHIEEISINWRQGFSALVKKDAEEDSRVPEDWHSLWKGIVHKSVVLMPLKELVTIALRGVHEQRRARIMTLLAITRKHQARLNISARLPGFKRQAMEAEKSGEDSDKIVQEILTREDGNAILDQWRITRRMLTRYNWLSTRVGDDSVPIAGVVQGILTRRTEEGVESHEEFPALVPLRQRRFVELFGKQWESLFYSDSPHTDDIEIFVNNEEFRASLVTLGLRAEEDAAAEPGMKPAALG